MITPSATLPTSRPAPAVPIPKPTATGVSPASALVCGDQIGQLRRQLAALAGGADGGDDVDEPAGDVADLLAAPLGRRRRDQRHHRDPGRGEGLADPLVLAQRQVGDDHARGAGGAASLRELDRAAVREHHVHVDHQHHRDLVADRLADLQRGPQRRPLGQRLGGGGVDRGTVGERVGERHAELDQVGARVDVGARDRQPRIAVGEPGHHVRHQRRAAFVLGGGEDGADPLLAGIISPRSCARTRRGPCRRARRGRGRRSPRPRAGSPAARRSRGRTPAPG